MLKKILVLVLVLNGSFASVFAQVIPTSSSKQRDSIKTQVIQMGENKRIKSLVLNDGTKLKGFIKEIRSNSFVLVDGYRIIDGKVVAVDKGNSAREIQFDQVAQIQPYRSVGSAIIVGVIGISAGIAIALLLLPRN